MYTRMILDNAIHRGRELITADELKAKIQNGESINIVDARAFGRYEQSHIEGARSIPHDKIRADIMALDTD